MRLSWWLTAALATVALGAAGAAVFLEELRRFLEEELRW
jgi:hypothetical protein